MNFDRYIFEIPIYRISELNFKQELEKEVIRICQQIALFEELFPDNAKKKYEEHKKSMYEHQRYFWEYNEIIGYIGLYFFFKDIRAEYYFIEGLKVRKGSKQKINWMGKLFENKLIGDGGEPDDVFNLIKEEIEKVRKSKQFKNRYLDTTKFYEIGKYINWIELLANNN